MLVVFLVFAVVVATSIWVFTDAKARIESGEVLEPIETAAGWGWACALLWIVFFPWYLMRKSNSPVTTKPTLTRIVEQVTAPLNREAPMPASIADEILKFGQLRDQGLISEEDFELQRARLLGRPVQPAVAREPAEAKVNGDSQKPVGKVPSCSSCGADVTKKSDAFCRSCGGEL